MTGFARRQSPQMTLTDTRERTDSQAPPAATPGLSEIMARAPAENFPVAARFLSANDRLHLLNIYGFARLTDQLGDAAAGDRLALLDWLDSEVEAIFAERAPQHPIMRRLVPTVRRYRVPAETLRQLIEANRRDQHVNRYRSFDELVDYCRLSANPVGHLVLHLFEAATPERMWLSDQICTALQLTEHWQDVAEDYDLGRVYIPAEDLDRFSYSPREIGARQVNPAFRSLMQFEVARAHAMFDAGAPLVRLLPGRRGLAIAAFLEGGRAALRAIERADYDVLRRAPRPTRLDKAVIVTRLLRLALSW